MAHNIYQEMGYVVKDECYTTSAESNKLVKYLLENNIIDRDIKIWLPFDNDFSNIYKALKKAQCNITISNLELGLDFYLYEPKEWDIIITNPPFSKRTNLMKRLLSFDKPFIILQATQYFNNQFAVNFLCEYSNDFKFIMPRSRMSFLTYREKDKKISSSRNGASFYSFWLCYKTKLQKHFNAIKDSGLEKDIESYKIDGNIIIENHENLFNIGVDKL